MTRAPIEETVVFCRALRERGLAVTPSETVDGARALGLIDLDDRQETFLSLRAVLTSRVEDFKIFEELFDAFWRRISQDPRPQKLVDRDDAANDTRPVRHSSPGPARKALAYFLADEIVTQPRDAEPISVPGASNAESAAEKDFSLFEADELEEVSRLARRIVQKLARTRSRRWKPVRRGPRVNLRGTLRRSLKMGGEMVELAFRERKQKKTRLVVICDVSGSMDRYSRLLLQFIYGLQNSFARVETFVFSTRLERITGHLKDKTYQLALDHLSINVSGWSGGTLIGPSIADFNSHWFKLVDKRTIVIVLSDGWDTAEPETLATSLAALRGRAGRLIWLNPLLGSPTYQPLTRGMQAALPHIDVFAPAHSLASLRALEQHLVL